MKSTITTMAIVLASVSLATAQDEPAKPEGKPRGAKHIPEEIFKRLDTNSDGKISLEEWKAGPRGQKNPVKAGETFKKVDTSGDGFVSLEEFKANPPKGGKPPGGGKEKDGAKGGQTSAQ